MQGKILCGLPKCPIMNTFHAQVRTAARGASYMGRAPSVFVGSYGYPAVSAGPLMTADPDAPRVWVAQGLSIEDIVGIRAQTIRGSAGVEVGQRRDPGESPPRPRPSTSKRPSRVG